MLQNKLLQEFLKFCLISLKEYKQITFYEYPKITLTVQKNKVQTLASFNPNTNEIICYTPKRLVADVFRSIAHELVHFAQNMKQELSQNSGDTGSDIENEANSLAGIIMRDFGKKFPQIFVTSFDEMVSKNDTKYEKLLQQKFENSEQIEHARKDNDEYLKSLFPITEENKNIKYETSYNEDNVTIVASIDNLKIGSLSMEILSDAYQYEFEDIFDEDIFDELYPDSDIIKISYIDVNDKYKNLGIGYELMNRGMTLMKNKGYTQFYLNASPMGFSGLKINDLVNFYKKFGFKILLNQGNNVLMGIVSKSTPHNVNGNNSETITEESTDNKTSLNGISLIKTGTPFLDQMIENPSYYFFNKQIEAKIEIMSPQEYLDKCNIMQNSKDDIENSPFISQENLKKYADKIKSGEIFPLPYLDYSSKGQEGRHRAIVLKRLGVTEMPVLIINKVSDTIISTYSKFIKNNYNTFEEAKKFILKNLKFELDERSFNNIIKGYINESTDNKHKFGCLMLKLNFKNWNKILEQIPEDKLYIEINDDSYGKEFEPHVTILYGFTENNDVNKIKKSIKTLKNPVKLSLNKINLFENEKFDVVKFNVVSKDLHKLHKIFATNFENKESYPTYEPHCTIAYVKKGFGKEFVTNLKQNIELESSTFMYSEPSGAKHVFEIDNLHELIKLGENHLDEYAQNIIKKLVEKFRTENPNLTDEQLNYYIQRFEQLKSSPKVTQKDILKYSFAELEKLVDSFPTKMKSQPNSGGTNDVEFSDGELIYNKSPLQLFHGDSPKQCVKIKGDFSASWCIARTSGNMYHNYRFGNAEPSFYFVKNLERLNKISQLNDDPYCFFVVQINNQGKYIVTNALNDGDKEMRWEQLLQIEPLLNGTDKLFVQKALSDGDRVDYGRFKNGISNEEYKNLSFDEKKKYISIRNVLNDDNFINTPDELLNDYISLGVELTNGQLKFIEAKKQLLNNYRRVTINTILPKYLSKEVPSLGSRWSVLTDDEATSIYKKRPCNFEQIIIYKPRIITNFNDKFDDKLSQYDNRDIIEILCKGTIDINSFQKYFLHIVNSFTIEEILRIIRFNPSYIKLFKNKLDKLDSNVNLSVKYILQKYPKLIDYFINNLNILSDEYVYDILEKHPDLEKYFKDRTAVLTYLHQDRSIQELIKLGEYFLTKNGDETYEDFDKVGKTNFLSECDCEDIEDEEINELLKHIKQTTVSEALYQGKSVTLNKPTRGDVKKFKVFVKNKQGKVIKVNFGSKDYNIKKNNPDRKKSYCARSKGIEGGGKDKTKANYWSRRMWNC